MAWAVGVVICLGYYAFKTTRWARTTTVGREAPIFPRWNVAVKPLQSPAGRWVVSVEPVETRAGGVQIVSEPHGWPPWISDARRVNFILPYGTWEAGRGALRRVWRLPSVAWTDEGHLEALVSFGAEGHPFRLDLKNGRTKSNVELQSPDAETTYEDDLYGEDYLDVLGVLNSTLEGGDNELEFSKQKRYKVGERKLFLLWALWAKGKRHPIAAVSDEAAPRVLRLVDDGVPIEFGKDGRTLWFSRANVLWRLDLRKPLPELLDQAPLPKLPEPPLD
jgi:hypothetical protein